MLISIISLAAFTHLAATTPQTGNPTIDLLLEAGPTGILVFMVIAFLKGWIVPGREVSRVRAERDRALELVYKQAELTQKAIELSASEKKS